jgi:hypothetical protein
MNSKKNKSDSCGKATKSSKATKGPKNSTKATGVQDTPAVTSGAGRKATSVFISSAAVSSAVAAIVGFAF